MKSLGFLLFTSVIISITASCNKSESINKESIYNKNCSDCFFNTKKDSENWIAINCWAIYQESDDTFILIGDQFDQSLSGSQIVIFISYSKNIIIGNPYSVIRAEYNFIVGGDAGNMPYELDDTYENNQVEVTHIDKDNQIIEGNFCVKLKRKSFYDNSDYKEDIVLNNGSFKLYYEKYDLLD